MGFSRSHVPLSANLCPAVVSALYSELLETEVRVQMSAPPCYYLGNVIMECLISFKTKKRPICLPVRRKSYC
jgi:hypothetical protein